MNHNCTCRSRLAARSLRQRPFSALRVLLHISQLSGGRRQAGGGLCKVLLSAIQHSNFGLKLAGKSEPCNHSSQTACAHDT